MPTQAILKSPPPRPQGTDIPNKGGGDSRTAVPNGTVTPQQARAFWQNLSPTAREIPAKTPDFAQKRSAPTRVIPNGVANQLSAPPLREERVKVTPPPRPPRNLPVPGARPATTKEDAEKILETLLGTGVIWTVPYQAYKAALKNPELTQAAINAIVERQQKAAAKTTK